MSKETQQAFASILMTPTEAASHTTLSKALLRLMSREGKFPAPRKIGDRRIAYVRAEVEGWLAERIGAAPNYPMFIIGGAAQ